MRWDEFRRSDNVEDRRAAPDGGFGTPIKTGGLGIGTILVLGLLGWALGIDPRFLIGGAEILTNSGQSQTESGPSASGQVQTGAPTDRIGQFVAAVLGDTEDRWKEFFQDTGRNLPGAQARHAFGRDTLGLRNGPVGNGTVLLPE
jgi:uncharacterized protein